MCLQCPNRSSLGKLALSICAWSLLLPAAATASDERPADAQSGSIVGTLSAEPTDFNFSSTDITLILKAFSARFNRNIVPAASVSGKVSLALKQVPFDEGFRMLLDKLDLVAIQRSRSIIEVVKKKDMPLVTETFNLKKRSAGDIKTTLDALLPEQEKEQLTIAVDNASNSLIITGNTAQIGKLRNLITQLDIKTPQIRIKTRIVELTSGNALSMGITWAGALKHGGVTARAANNMGSLVQPAGVAGITPITSLVDTTYKSGGFFDLSQVMDKAALYGVLNMIAENNNGKTLSEPSIMTENNKTAKIHVGKNLPVKTIQVTQVAQIQTISYINEGIDLEVTPVVSPGNKEISMKVRINVSEFTGFQADSPITTERSAYTEITIESEKTVAIGGLKKESFTNVRSGIPVLRAIPILGALFRTTKKESSQTDLLILLTPEIMPL